MALGKSRTSINVKGGGDFWIRELSPTATNTYSQLGYIASTDFIDEASMVGEPDEAGNLIDSKRGARKCTVSIVLKQTGIDEINLLKNAANKYYEGYYKVPVKNGTMVQEVSIPLMKITPKISLKFASATERQLPVDITMLAPKANFTRTRTAFNITENEPYIIVENTDANFDLNNTEAAAIASAII